MKSVKMLRDFKVSLHGWDVETWKNGEVYSAHPELANDLITALLAVEVTGDRKVDASAEADAIAQLELQAEEAAAAEALKAAASAAATKAVKAVKGAATA
jgi:hypothetical protein